MPRALVGPDRAACDFIDTETGRRWTLHPSTGRVPVWMLAPWRAVPGTSAVDFLRLFAMARAGPADTVARMMPRHGLGRRYFWEPLCIAALNTEPAAASAQALWQMLRNVLASGESPLLPQFVKRDLTTDLIDPAVRTIVGLGGEVRYGSKLHAIERDSGRATMLRFGEFSQALGPGEQVVLAVPSAAAGELLQDLTCPRDTRAIVTAHFVLDPPAAPEPKLTSIIATRPLWVLTRGDLATVSTGAADDLMDVPRAEVARRLWEPAARALNRGNTLPAWHVLKFRQGTYAHTPADEARRPPARTRWSNLFLAGDWTRTGQSATVDGAIQSGYAAADAALRR